MIVPLAAAALALGLATASSQADNTTSAQAYTIVPLVPVIASSKSHLETPHTEAVPATYPATGTAPDYGNLGPTTITGYAPIVTSGPNSTSSSLPPGEIVHTENSQDALATPTAYTTSPSVMPPAPIALSKYTTVIHPTLPSVYSSPIALSEHSSVAHPTLPGVTSSPIALSKHSSVVPPTVPIYYSPIALSKHSSVAPPTMPASHDAQQTATTTLEPLIVHTERPAESLEVPSSKTNEIPGHETTKPAVPLPGGDDGEGPRPSEYPTKIVTVPTTLVTLAPEVVVTMGGYQSSVKVQGDAQPVVTTIPESVMTGSGGEVMTVPAAVYTLPVLPVSVSESVSTRAAGSSTTAQTSSSEEPSETTQPGGSDEGGSEDYEGAGSVIDVGLWRYSLLGMAVGVVAVM